MQNAATIKKILAQYNLAPIKEMGQNFLIDKNIQQKIITAGEISKTDTIIEVGAGIGNITLEIAKHAKKVIAIEKDKKLIPILTNTVQGNNNVKIENEDILNFHIQEKKYKVIANIPYYITSPIIQKFLQDKNPPSSMILTIQKEVAQRICARPPHMSVLSVSVQFFAIPKIVSYISKNSFWPIPNVSSAVLKITNINKNKQVDIAKFFKTVRMGFSHPRKQLVKNLHLQDVAIDKKIEDIDLQRRAETLTIEEWIKLTNLIPLK